MFEEKIVKSSKEKLAKLYGAASIAEEKPDTGVKIIEKSAYYIIRDCAKITKKYLPLFLYGMMKNPIKNLKGKFTEKEIREFVKRCDTSKSAEQLLNLILKDIKGSYPEEDVTPSVFDPIEDDEYDPYSEYGIPKAGDGLVDPKQTIEVVDILITAFAK